MKIDLHMHCRERSSCGTSTEAEMLAAARRFGLDAVAFTDHNRLVHGDHLARLNEEYAPLRVFGGIEISITMDDHCIVVGIDDPEIQTRQWNYERLVAFVREHAGWIAVCHPFRTSDAIPFDLRSSPPDAIEIHSVHTPADEAPRIRELARELGIATVGNSDAHVAAFAGIFHNEVPGAPATGRELAARLRAGPIEPRRDEARAVILNRMVDEREAMIRRMISMGVDGGTFGDMTGVPVTHYRRVLRGKSFKV